MSAIFAFPRLMGNIHLHSGDREAQSLRDRLRGYAVQGRLFMIDRKRQFSLVVFSIDVDIDDAFRALENLVPLLEPEGCASSRSVRKFQPPASAAPAVRAELRPPPHGH